MSDYNAFKGASSEAQCSDGCNSGIGTSATSFKLSDPKAPKLGGSAQSDSRGKQGSN